MKQRGNPDNLYFYEWKQSLSFTASSTYGGYQVWGLHLMRPKGMKTWPHSMSEMRREQLRKERSTPLLTESQSQSKGQSHPNEFSENCRIEVFVGAIGRIGR